MTPTPIVPPYDPKLLALPDDEMVGCVWTWWIAAQMTAKGIPLDDYSPQMEQVIIRETLRSDTDQESVSGLERAMQAIALRDVERGAKMFRDFMRRGSTMHAALDEAVTGRRKQRAIARKPREDTLNRIIREIVEKDPRMTEPQLFERLRCLEKQGPIGDITNEDIWVQDEGEAGKSVPISGLGDRLRRIKKKLKPR